MFTLNRRDESHQLDDAITKLIDEIQESTPGDEIHTNSVLSLKVLMEARNADKAAAKRTTVSPDAIAAIAANLLSIGLILGFEKANVITSKSLGFVPKVKI